MEKPDVAQLLTRWRRFLCSERRQIVIHLDHEVSARLMDGALRADSGLDGLQDRLNRAFVEQARAAASAQPTGLRAVRFLARAVGSDFRLLRA